ncbi:serine hydroxymethyltransferase [Fodinicurvata halophila]|uniref:Probable serine hydroxymethyltransferase n=1 Tax=Fodinicurvata halophila TaxID=1419723 RepID=A0ABV8UGG0_9PROT
MDDTSILHSGYFTSALSEVDPEAAQAIDAELTRQRDVAELIASENYVSQAVLEAQGSIMTNKSTEGYPGSRYHSGAENADRLEKLAIERACTLFGCRFANVQPHSGSQANDAIFMALLNPGDTVLSMALDAGGHLSHGAAVNITGKWFEIVSYGVKQEDGRIDYDQAERLAEEQRPRLIIAGGSSYSRTIDFERFQTMADKAGAYLLVDMAHFAGLVAGKAHPNPFPHADVAMATTYKSLRGARGGIILSNDEKIARRIDATVFPGFQGTPYLQGIAGKAVTLGEALKPEFRTYARQVVANTKALSAALMDRGYHVVTGGSDTTLLLVDLRGTGLTGNVASDSLDRAGITCNKNAVPGDPEKPTVTSGLRFGTSAGTTRGFREEEFQRLGHWIADVLDGLRTGNDTAPLESAYYAKVRDLTARFPIYG